MLNHKKKEEIVAQVKEITKKYGLDSFIVFTPRIVEHTKPFYVAFSVMRLNDMFDIIQVEDEFRTIKEANVQFTDTSFIEYNNQSEISRRARLVEDINKGEVYYTND